MKRLYTVEYYREMLARCRETVPGVAVSSDFIVGFCGETEESFEQTCDLVRDGQLQEQLHLQVQPAARHQGPTSCSPTTCPKRSRSAATTTCWPSKTPISLADHRRWIGRTVEVLVEGPSKTAAKHDTGTGPKQLTGRTPMDHIVVFEGNERLIGQTVQIHVEDATTFTLFGTVITGEQVGVERERQEQLFLARPAALGGRVSLPLV